MISGEEESRLAYLAVTAGTRPRRRARSSSSTPAAAARSSRSATATSVDERFSVERRRGALHRAVRARPGRLRRRRSPRRSRDRGRPRRARRAAARPTRSSRMGGAVTNLAAVKHGLATYDPDVVQGTVLDRAEIDRQIELYRTRTPTSGARSSGCSPSAPRSSSPAPASCARCSTKLGRESLTVSDRGLRHGLLIERADRRTRLDRACFSRRLPATRNEGANRRSQ